MATEEHKKYRSGTVTTFSGANTPDDSYEAPTITVPATAAEYKDYNTWEKGATSYDTLKSAGKYCKDGGDAGGGGDAGAGGDAGGGDKADDKKDEDEEKKDDTCEFKMSIFRDDNCTDAPFGN